QSPVTPSRANSTVPASAIPAAAPTRWAVWRTPPALPARRTGTSLRVRVMFGEITVPLPNPASSSAGATAHGADRPGTSSTTRAVAATPTPTVTRPAATSGRPTRVTM